MEKIRVHELGKMYGLTNDQMIDFLIRNDIDVVNHMSTVDMDAVSKIIKKLEIKRNLGEHKNKNIRSIW